MALWKESVLAAEEIIKEDRFIFIVGKVRTNDRFCGIGNVYGPIMGEERVSFFSLLGEVLRNRRGCCVLGGDFNATLS